MRYFALIVLIVSEGFWVPANALGLSLLLLTAIVSITLILKGWA